MNRDEIIEYLGAENWGMVEDEFEYHSPVQIEETLNDMFPGENNYPLAHAIYNELND